MALNFLLADDARMGVAIVHRNRPKCVGLWRWDLETDQFYAGQWMAGRLHHRRCDLSADGELMLIFAANHQPHRDVDTWTAITRAPYLTALAFWAWGGTYGGGGLFEGKHILLNTLGGSASKPDTKTMKLPKVRGVDLGSGGGFHRRLSRRGWVLVKGELSERWQEAKPGNRWQRVSPTDPSCTLEMRQHRALEPTVAGALLTGTERHELGEVRSLAFDQNGDVLYSVGFELFRRTPGGPPVRIASFAETKFTPEPSPRWARSAKHKRPPDPPDRTVTDVEPQTR